MSLCQTCDGYQLVPRGDGSGRLMDCPDCHRPRRCPIHGESVIVRDGVIVGRCWGCMNEVAEGLAWMRAHPYSAQAALIARVREVAHAQEGAF